MSDKRRLLPVHDPPRRQRRRQSGLIGEDTPETHRPGRGVERLPRSELGIPDLDADPFWRLVAAFLVECRREQTRRAYFNDLRAWYPWCVDRELHSLAAHRDDVALRARQLANKPQRSGRTEAPASIARRLSCLSSFYG